jgi:hypothetical protein
MKGALMQVQLNLYPEFAGKRNRKVDLIYPERFTFDDVAEGIEALVTALKAAREEADANNWPKPLFFQLHHVTGTHLPAGMITKAAKLLPKLAEVNDVLDRSLFICGPSAFMMTMGQAWSVIARNMGVVRMKCEEAHAIREQIIAASQS